MIDPEIAEAINSLLNIQRADVLRLFLTIRHKDRAVQRRLEALEQRLIAAPVPDESEVTR
ncbi:MAG TPA: hypothetical protein VHA14_17240 [Bryobacteraceae bacterium]|nr:hypothetical protein [Bryobacteraceae bacterium]